MVYFIGLGVSIVLGVQYFKLNEQYSNSSFHDYLKRKEMTKLCEKNNFKLEDLDKKQQELENAEKLLKSNILLNL